MPEVRDMAELKLVQLASDLSQVKVTPWHLLLQPSVLPEPGWSWVVVVVVEVGSFPDSRQELLEEIGQKQGRGLN